MKSPEQPSSSIPVSSFETGAAEQAPIRRNEGKARFEAAEDSVARLRRESETIAKSVSPERGKELDVRSAHSFEELFRTMYAWGPEEGFDVNEQDRRIARVRKGESILLVTPRFGLQQRVDELLKIEQIRGGLNPSPQLESLTALNKRIGSLEMEVMMNPQKYDQMLRDARGEKERMLSSAWRTFQGGRELMQ